MNELKNFKIRLRVIVISATLYKFSGLDKA